MCTFPVQGQIKTLNQKPYYSSSLLTNPDDPLYSLVPVYEEQEKAKQKGKTARTGNNHSQKEKKEWEEEQKRVKEAGGLD